jgi:ATP-dependent DNA helicase RecG
LEIAKSAVAMANTRGGTIFLGVDNNGIITGFQGDKPEEKIRDLLKDCDPPLTPKVNLIRHNLGLVVRISVSEGTDKPYTVKGRGIIVRSGSTDRAATRYEIDQMRRISGF